MGAAEQIAFMFEKKPLWQDNEKVNYKRYSKFKSGREFDSHWEQFICLYKKQYTKPQLMAMNIVRQAAVRHNGVCNLSYRTLIKKSVQRYGKAISRDTFRTAIDKTEELGGCVKHAGVRLRDGRGSRSANVVIFARIEDVKAHQILAQTREMSEIDRLLEEGYATADAMNNFAYNARKWQEDKKEAQRRKAEHQARKERERKEREAAAKRDTLFFKCLAILKANKLDTTAINEYMSILYGSINKTVKADPQITRARAEMIALDQFKFMARTKDEDIRKNRFAYLSHLLRSNLIALTDGYKTDELARKRAEKAGKGRVEAVPEWFNESETEAARKKAENEAKMQSPEMQQKIAEIQARLKARNK